MAYRKIEDSKLTAIADAVRAKLGVTDTMKPDDVPELIESIGIGVIPSYWKNYLDSKVVEINTAINVAGANKSTFLWYTDAHWTTNYGQSPMILKYLSKHTGMKKTIFGGDAATAKSGEISVLDNWKNLVKGIPNHYSVLGNHDNQVTEFATVTEQADYFLLYNRSGDMSTGTNAAYGKSYYYFDNHIENTRYICLSTGRMCTNSDEVSWCIDVLNSVPKNWHVVIVSHLWLNCDYSNDGAIIETPVSYTQGYLDMFDAYNYRLSGTESHTGVSYSFTGAQGKIEFIIGGHVHQDYDFTTTKGIPVILTESDSYQERDATSVATKGTTTENCVYAIIADFDARQIKIINVGRGDTRSEAIPKVVTYTNVLPTAEYPVGTILNGVGYMTGTRLSVSSGNFEHKTESGWCTSGLIKATAGDVIRFRNCKFTISNPSSGTQRQGVYGADANGDYITNKMASVSDTVNPFSTVYKAVFDADGDNMLQITLPSMYSSSTYIRIVVQSFTGESIITVNEEID